MTGSDQGRMKHLRAMFAVMKSRGMKAGGGRMRAKALGAMRSNPKISGVSGEHQGKTEGAWLAGHHRIKTGQAVPRPGGQNAGIQGTRQSSGQKVWRGGGRTPW